MFACAAIVIAGDAVAVADAAIVIAGDAVAVADAAIVIPGDAVVAGVVVAGAVVIIILLPREVTGDVVNVVGRDITMTGIFPCLWAPARQPRWVSR